MVRVKSICAICANTDLWKRAGLNTHIKSKHECVQYPCDQCGKQFSYSSSLQIHLQSVHGGQRFPCDQCGHEATQLSNLKTHMMNIHGSK